MGAPGARLMDEDCITDELQYRATLFIVFYIFEFTQARGIGAARR